MARIRNPNDTGHGPEDQLAGSPPASADVGPEPGDGQPPQEQTEVIAADEHHAGHLRQTVPSIFMFASLSQAFKIIDQRAYKIYRDDLLADCGNPTDPIEIMIIEQLALAHFGVGLLSCKAANAGKVEAVGVYCRSGSEADGGVPKERPGPASVPGGLEATGHGEPGTCHRPARRVRRPRGRTGKNP